MKPKNNIVKTDPIVYELDYLDGSKGNLRVSDIKKSENKTKKLRGMEGINTKSPSEIIEILRGIQD
jgi:hypothetical protein